jgi:hypothetical protein
MTVDEIAARGEMVMRVFKFFEKAHALDEGTLRIIVAESGRMPIVQFAAACADVMRNPPKGPLGPAIIAKADSVTRLQIAADRAAALRVLPMVPIDTTRSKQQVAILERWARPAGATWNESELDTIRGELERDAGRTTETWIERQRRLFPSLPNELADIARSPQAIADDRAGIPATREQTAFALQRIQANLAHLQRIGAGPRRVAGVRSVGEGVGRAVREPGEEG